MGWMRTLLLGDIGNRLDIEETEHDIHRLGREMRRRSNVDRRQDLSIDRLSRENAELRAVVGGMARLLVDKGVLSREELTFLVEGAEEG